jgi:hypothetical protein
MLGTATSSAAIPCGAERPIDEMLAAYDDALDEHHELLVRQYERDGLPPPTRAEFDDERVWVMGDGTASRACFQRLGDARRYRKDGFWGCVQDYIEDEEQGARLLARRLSPPLGLARRLPGNHLARPAASVRDTSAM